MTFSLTAIKENLPRGGLAGLYMTRSPKLFYFQLGHNKITVVLFIAQ